MIDFHTHILQNIDDGAATPEMSLALIDSLIEQGVNEIVLTPHFYFNKISIDDFILQRKNSFNILSAMLKDRPVKLIPACEVYISKAKLTDNLNKFAIKGTGYLFIELPFRTAYSKNLITNIDNIMNYTGLTPIIAHAERYPALMAEPACIYYLIKAGCVIQLNTCSLFDKRYKNLAYKMLDKRQVHIIGTDCHNMEKRPPLYEAARHEIEKRYGKEYFLMLQQNMRDILDNKEIELYKTSPIRKFFNIYF